MYPRGINPLYCKRTRILAGIGTGKRACIVEMEECHLPGDACLGERVRETVHVLLPFPAEQRLRSPAQPLCFPGMPRSGPARGNLQWPLLLLPSSTVSPFKRAVAAPKDGILDLGSKKQCPWRCLKRPMLGKVGKKQAGEACRPVGGSRSIPFSGGVSPSKFRTVEAALSVDVRPYEDHPCNLATLDLAVRGDVFGLWPPLWYFPGVDAAAPAVFAT